MDYEKKYKEALEVAFNSIPSLPSDVNEAVDKYTDNPANYLEYSDDGWEDKTDIDYVERAFKAGSEWRQSNLWKSADGDDLPEIDKPKTCGECGYFMRYVKEGKPHSIGDCASIGMNKECLDGINPFRVDDEILQVEENEEACGYFKANRPVRVRKYIKDNSKYSNKRSKKQ